MKRKNLNFEYKGETGKNAYTRSKQHMRGLKNKNPENAFYKHWQNFHETPYEEDNLRLNNFEIRVEQNFQDPMSRWLG